ncbi:MAG TPA: flagellar hook-length control protein FliK [Dissulfurispiraceae bacterium]|nr:flagellar hook-length control protein FliK [Dissulfurispiraceae bacterium]
MINFKVSDLSEGLITVIKPVGKPIPLNIGEIVKADVMDILPTGGVTLRIKGSYITARTDIDLQKDSEVLLKVVGTPSSANELRLQFVGEAEKEQAAPAFRGEALNKLLQQYPGTAENVESLLKLLPSDSNSIPKDIRIQLQAILQNGLKATGQSIQSRLDALFKGLPDMLRSLPDVQCLRLDATVSIDRLLSAGLKGLLMDTGVALESKLKAVAELMQQASRDGSAPEMAAADTKLSLSMADRESIDNDLKANVLKLKDVLEAGVEGASAKDTAAIKNASAAADGILRDIESYQLLSKATESFYTFLPVSWQQLRDGEIAFRQNMGEAAASSFSCRLNLDLDTFGKLKIAVLLHNNEFFVSFRPEKDDFRSLLASGTVGLEGQFKDKGLNLKAVRVLDKDDTSLEQLENLEPFKGIVSVKA